MRVRFATTTALDGLDLVANRGRVTALLGPNGAGKTTLLRCLTGLITPDAGEVRVLGEEPGSPVAQSSLGVMPQATGAWSGMRAGELVAYLARLYAHPLDVGALITQFGIDAFARTPYRRLSGGQQQLVNLAGAVVGRPSVVALDEPTAGMDPRVRRHTWSLIRDLRAAGVSVLLTTHDMAEAQALADDVVIIDHGRATVSGSVAELTSERSLEELFLEHTEEDA